MARNSWQDIVLPVFWSQLWFFGWGSLELIGLNGCWSMYFEFHVQWWIELFGQIGPMLQVEFLTERQPSTEPFSCSRTSCAGSQLIAMEETEERQWPLHPAAAKADAFLQRLWRIFLEGQVAKQGKKTQDEWFLVCKFSLPSAFNFVRVWSTS